MSIILLIVARLCLLCIVMYGYRLISTLYLISQKCISFSVSMFEAIGCI